VDARVAALEAEVCALKELVRRLDLEKQEIRQDLRAERDAWKAQTEAAQRLLSVAQSSVKERAGRGWFGLFRQFRGG
jgi:hypothetical protein